MFQAQTPRVILASSSIIRDESANWVFLPSHPSHPLVLLHLDRPSYHLPPHKVIVVTPSSPSLKSAHVSR